MSDVEKRLAQWRVDLDESEGLSQADVQELESHLREEMEHLQTAGLSAEEAFFVGRHRLGDRAALEEEFAKVNPQQRLAHRLYWMTLGLLSWFVWWPLADHLSTVSAYLAYALGLQGALLTWFALLIGLALYALMGLLVLRYLASHWPSRVMTKRLSTPVCVGVCAMAANMLLCWTVNFAHHHVWERLIPTGEIWRQLALPQTSTAWYALMMLLLAGGLAVFARQSRKYAEVP